MKGLQIGDLTVELPIIQGGMGIGVSMSGLAAAVANAGGVVLSLTGRQKLAFVRPVASSFCTETH